MFWTTVRSVSVTLAAVALISCGESENQPAAETSTSVQTTKTESIQPSAPASNPPAAAIAKEPAPTRQKCINTCLESSEYLSCMARYGDDEGRCSEISGKCVSTSCVETK